MQDNYEETKEISVDDLVPDSQPAKKTAAKSSASKKNTSAKKKGKQPKKFKPIYLVPVIFIVVVLLVGLSVWRASRQDGPVYGNRCDGMTEIPDSAISQTIDEIKSENSSVSDLTITIDCKTVKINVSMSDDAGEDEVKQACEAILLKLDGKVGLAKSNSESAYSDLLGVLNGKTQYDVGFSIKGSTDIFPVFASKHSTSDAINYTWNTARDPDLAESLQAEQAAADDDEGANAAE